MTCPLCAQDPLPADFATPRRCAFGSGVFSSDNWNCETVNALRSLAVWQARDDDQNESLAVVPMPPNDYDVRGYVVLAFYKDRGAVYQARFVCEDRAELLTLEQAMIALDAQNETGISALDCVFQLASWPVCAK